MGPYIIWNLVHIFGPDTKPPQNTLQMNTTLVARWVRPANGNPRRTLRFHLRRCGCDFVHLVVQRHLFQYHLHRLQRPVRFQISDELHQFRNNIRPISCARSRFSTRPSVKGGLKDRTTAPDGWTGTDVQHFRFHLQGILDIRAARGDISHNFKCSTSRQYTTL